MQHDSSVGAPHGGPHARSVPNQSGSSLDPMPALVLTGENGGDFSSILGERQRSGTRRPRPRFAAEGAAHARGVDDNGGHGVEVPRSSPSTLTTNTEEDGDNRPSTEVLMRSAATMHRLLSSREAMPYVH